MSFLGNYFNFAGINSKDFGLKIVSINGNLTDIPSGSGYEYQTVSAIRNPKKLFLGLKESNALEFSIEIVSENPIDLPTFLRIKQWLFGNIGYQKLQIESEWYEDFYFNCILKPTEDIKFGGECFGVRCTVECDSSYAYTFPTTKTYTFDSSIMNPFEFDNLSAEIYGLRPIIEFKLSNSGKDFKILNLKTNRIFEMTNLSPNEIITVDNQNEIITSNTGLNRFKNLSRGKNQGYLSFTHVSTNLSVMGMQNT
ncbi:MAG: hypothetical protein IJI84_06110 [Clostridia bacterium]|nr:hypothetical protein [Clostridia bacterium]